MRIWPSTICGACVLSLFGSVSAMDQQAVAILRKSAQNIGQIHSIQFSVSISTKERQSGREREFDDSMVFTYASGRMRSEVHLTDRTTGEELHKVSIFDGGRYQMFDEKAGQLVLSNSPTAPMASLLYSPLELPYSFLWRKAPLSFGELRDSTTWNAVFEHCTYAGTGTVNELRCEKIRIPMLASPNHEATWLVFFAHDLNYYPVKSVLNVNGNEIRGLIEVRVHETKSSTGAETVIPTDVLFVEYSKQEKDVVSEQVELLVDSDSIKLNSEFDEDFFTIASSRAEWVIDVDAGTNLHIGGKAASLSRDSRHRWRAALAFALIAAIVTLTVAWKVWTRRRSARNA